MIVRIEQVEKRIWLIKFKKKQNGQYFTAAQIGCWENFDQYIFNIPNTQIKVRGFILYCNSNCRRKLYSKRYFRWRISSELLKKDINAKSIKRIWAI